MTGKEEKERAARNCPKLARIARRPLEAGLDNSWKVPHYTTVSLGIQSTSSYTSSLCDTVQYTFTNFKVSIQNGYLSVLKIHLVLL